ncbi:DNA replication/repair protein RecF [candidate division WS5 bacterium]|uniref:DNA replication and repair protein RecF n=1 Tax=candidate division WS5 bacterium TaxID=2093353 RepID=A0A419DGP2_9BACT|nr:MAG: DNA replication/repair protein RecF [candidate division WS5 bacterium]
MKINSIKLQNFRSYKNLEVSFGEKNIIIGENTQGKTNLLEAIYLTSIGKSFRSKEADMVLWGKDHFRIESKSVNGNPQKVEYIYEKNVGQKGRKTVKINGVKKPASALLGGFSSVFFTPDEIDMFFAFPSLRRRHINILLSKIESEYARELIKYNRVLEQRNAQLKAILKGLGKEEGLELWDGRLAEHGAEIIKSRESLIEKINKTLGENYTKIADGGKEAVLKYEPSINIRSNQAKDEIWAAYLERLLEGRKRDIKTGVTNEGPHRDDIKLFLADKDITVFGSRGEHRSAIVALKLSEVDILNELTGEPPVLLMDDVFSELDEKRREKLVKAFEGQQTIVTTTDLDHITKELRKGANIYEAKNDKIVRI